MQILHTGWNVGSLQSHTDRAEGHPNRVPGYRGLVDFGLVVALILPIFVIQIVLIVLAVRDLLRPERTVRGVSKGVWLLVIVFFQWLGPLIYFAMGRENE